MDSRIHLSDGFTNSDVIKMTNDQIEQIHMNFKSVK